jgi:EpsI family protein
MGMVRRSIVLTGLMALTAIGGFAIRPSAKANNGGRPRYVLETVVPRQFGDWRELPAETAQVVNPQTQQLLDKLYSQVLSRTYINSAGYRIMLSIAYGDDQRGDLAAHKPEICYPAQGFELNEKFDSPVKTPFGSIDARRLDTSRGRYKEPVTYWFTMGDEAVKSNLERRIVEVRLGLTGQIPDGLLFRVSSPDPQSPRAYGLHDAFVADLLRALSATDRKRLSGLGPVASPG